MSIVSRKYKYPDDFNRIGQFLIDTYRPGDFHENWLQPRWEYMHYHPLFDETLQAAFLNTGIWESEGEIVAAVHFEHEQGEVYFQVHPEFHSLKPDMLEYAEKNLSVKTDNGKRKITVWVNDFENNFESTVKEHGYQLLEGRADCWSVFKVPDPFPPIKLPDGFRIRSLADENDLYKLDRVIHRGFNHPGEPPDDGLAGRKKMQSAPNYRKDLNIVTVTPDGVYASYCGIWLQKVHRIAYVEPVCTDPDYRRMGLGTAAVLEGIRRCAFEGAELAFVGSEQPFYIAMGFQKLFGINLWSRQWEV